MTSQTWQTVLEQEGFTSVFFPVQDFHNLGHQVIIAKSDGIIRQKQLPSLDTVLVEHQEQKTPSHSQPNLNTVSRSKAKAYLPAVSKTKTTTSGVNVTDQMVEDHLRTIIRECIAEVLKMDEGQIKDDQSFSDYGVDSIIGVNLINLIGKQCNITLQTTIIFDYNNVDQLTRFIISEHKSTLITLLQKSETKTTTSGVTVTDQMVEDHLRTIIRECIAEVLKMDEGRIKDDQSFSEYGVDSIIGVNLVNLIGKRCHITLQTTVIFDYNNVDQLTRFIISEHKSTLITLLRKDEPVSKETVIKSPEKAKLPAPEKQPDDYLIQSRSRSRFPTRNIRPDSDSNPTRNQPDYYRVIVEQPGGIDDLKLTKSEVPELKEDEVRIAVYAFSLNFGDLLCVKGLYPTMPPYPFTPGFEASGIVVDIGRAVTSIRRGDAVIALAGDTLGGQASQITCSIRELIFRNPKDYHLRKLAPYRLSR